MLKKGIVNYKQIQKDLREELLLASKRLADSLDFENSALARSLSKIIEIGDDGNVIGEDVMAAAIRLERVSDFKERALNRIKIGVVDELASLGIV